MSDEQQPNNPPRPPPVCAVLATASPFVCVVIPLYISSFDTRNGDFRSVIAMGYGLAGAIFGILLGIGFGISAHARRERNAFFAAATTLIVTSLSLLVVSVIYTMVSPLFSK